MEIPFIRISTFKLIFPVIALMTCQYWTSTILMTLRTLNMRPFQRPDAGRSHVASFG